MKKILSFALVLVMLVALCGCDASDYKKAMKAYDDGDYAEARDMFEALDDYKDSADLAKDCDYRLAKKAMDKEDFDKALSMLEKLDDYKDSEELAQECNYNLALKQMDGGKYDEAAKLLEKAGSYKDTADQLKECSYQLALADIAAGDLEAAEEKLTALEGYKDSADVLASLSGGAVLQLLAGQWECPLDISELIMTSIAESEGDEEVMSYLNFSNLNILFNLAFDNAGNWEMTVDQNSVDKMIEDIKQPLTTGLNAYFYDAMEALADEAGMSLQDLYSFFGVSSMDELLYSLLDMSIEEYVNEVFADSDSFFDSSDYVSAGTVEAQDDVLVVSSPDFTASGMSYDAAADEVTVTFYYNDLGIDSLTFTRK